MDMSAYVDRMDHGDVIQFDFNEGMRGGADRVSREMHASVTLSSRHRNGLVSLCRPCGRGTIRRRVRSVPTSSTRSPGRVQALRKVNQSTLVPIGSIGNGQAYHNPRHVYFVWIVVDEARPAVTDP